MIYTNKDGSLHKNRKIFLGGLFKNKQGCECEVIEFVDRKHYKVKFTDTYGAEVVVTTANLLAGAFKNPGKPSVCGIGFYGQGPYVAKVDGKHTPEYADWNSMMKRCYSKTQIRNSYKDKSINKSWWNFQIFADWATKQIGFKEGWHLDKDLLIKGNKEYSENSCVYLPQEINSFVRRKRQNNLPVGVDVAFRYNGTSYFRSQSVEDGKVIVLGAFETVEGAFSAYKEHKEMLAVKLAEKWKGKIDNRAYEALLNYQVEITD